MPIVGRCFPEKYTEEVRFGVLTSVSVNITLFLDKTTATLVDRYPSTKLHSDTSEKTVNLILRSVDMRHGPVLQTSETPCTLLNISSNLILSCYKTDSTQ